MTTDLLFLEHINSSLQSNIDLINSRYSNSGWQSYQAWIELEKYASANPMIKSICYVNKNTGAVLTTNSVILYEDHIFRIKASNTNNVFLEFDPSPYFDTSCGQMVSLANSQTQHLFYFPAQSSSLDYLIFFILDTNEIKSYLQKIISDTTPAMVLINSDGQVVTGINSEKLVPYLETLLQQNGIFKIDSNSSICIQTGIPGDFSAVSLISNVSLNRQLVHAFSNAYRLFFLLSCAGFLLVLLAMKITYFPLRRLAQKLVPGFSARQEFLTQIDDAFSNALEQNHLLEQKLTNYQISIKKSLLDAVIESNYSSMQTTLPNIDQLFDPGTPKELFVIYMKSTKNPFPHLLIKDTFQDALSGKDSCIVLKMDHDNAVFLINFTGTASNKKEFLLELLQNSYQKQGYLSTISNGSKSPLDIPALCENAIKASDFWPEIPVVDYQTLPLPPVTSFTYPHDQLEQLDKMLRSMNLNGAKSILEEIHQIIMNSIQEDTPLPDFFVRSILVDLITLIISYINQAKIPSEAYSDLYYETLYFCRSCPYEEKADAIEGNIDKLLDIYYQEAGNHITAAQIKLLIEESYCEPNFSIYELADKLQISFTYASNLIKKKLNQNFSDYVWILRFEKAKELLKTTDMSIDEISIAVGYLNTSSFRRKFKQETGLTPSQYRVKEQVQNT